MMGITIRKYREEDKDQIWEIIKNVISQADSFTYVPDTTREFALDDWCHPEKATYVAISGDEIIGTYYLKANQFGLGSHIANGGYMVSPDARSKGVGRLMGEHSLETAKQMGFRAMQFNIVVKSNVMAVNLWNSLGFEIIGEIPEAYRGKHDGFTDAYIMYKKLQ